MCSKNLLSYFTTRRLLINNQNGGGGRSSPNLIRREVKLHTDGIKETRGEETVSIKQHSNE